MKFRAILDDKYKDDLDEKKKFVLKDWHKSAIYFFVIALVLNFLAILYITQGKMIFFWDNATYWNISRRMVSGAMSEGGFWHNVYNSTVTEDYNYIAALPSALVMKIFGTSRLAYVIGLCNMYLLPSYIVIYLLAKKISKAPMIATTITILIMPCMAFITFVGFVDVGALLMCLLAYNLYYTRKDEKDKPWHYIIIGILIVFAMLWRRYFAFFGVSFITAMAADCILCKKKWYNTAITVATAVIILFVFFRGFVFERLMADYGDLYAGYKFSLGTDLKLLTRYFGFIFILGLLGCSVYTGASKKETRQIFPWIQIIVCFLMFISTQTHGQQHLILYMASFAVIMLLTVKHITKEWMFLTVCAVAVISSLFVYIPRKQPQNIQEIKLLSPISSFSMIPQKRTDTEEILRLKNDLDNIVIEGDKLGVLASSFTINEDIVKNVKPSMGIKETREDYIISLPQVDSRDRDYTALYNTNYVLLATPAQTHLAKENQTVVTEAVKSFENYADIAISFEEVEGFERELDGMKLKLFYRTKEVTPNQMREFESRVSR